LLLHDQMRLTEAEAFYREALEIDRQSSLADSLRHAYTLNNLGSLLEDLGRYGEAEALYRRSLELRSKSLGEDSRPYRRMLSSMGRLALRAGDLELAEDRLDRADAWFRENLDPDDHDRIQYLERRAQLLRARGDIEAATELLREALDRAERTFGEEHATHPVIRAELTMTLAGSTHPERCRAAVDAARAEPGYRGGTDLTRGRVELAAGLCAQALGRDEEAKASLDRALELLRPSLGDGNHWVRMALSQR
jgi:tetratricopeptide (TPR) repeat protein